jgi:hypothetical protein
MADFSVDSNVFFATPITANVTSHLAGLDTMGLTLGGGTTTTLAGATTINSNVDLQPVTSTATVTLTPLTTDSKFVTDSTVRTSSAIDLEPVAVDSCVRVELGPLPATELCTPYEQNWSFSLFGVELFSIGLSGTSRTQLRPGSHGPAVLDL